MENLKETMLELPWETVDQCNGFGLDFGGSVCKVIYLHKEDWKEPSQRNSSTAPMRCVNIARPHFEEGFEYLKDRVYIRRKTPDEKPLVYTTGVGGSQYANKIQDIFNIRTSNINELECLIIGFVYVLKNCKSGDLVHELNQAVVQDKLKEARLMNDALEGLKKLSYYMRAPPSVLEMKTTTFPQEIPLEREKKFTEYEDIFPCFCVMVGSNGGVFMVNEDGTYEFANDTKRGGRAFLGLGSILSGSKSYEEIMEKVGAGNTRNVNEFVTDLTGDEGLQDDEENMYTKMKDLKDNADPAFMFGKCVYKEKKDFKEEDLAKSLHYFMCSDIVQQTYAPLRWYRKVKHIFFSGGFPGHPLTRDQMLGEWIRREAEGMSFFAPDHLRNTHFMKHGSHMGAIGAYLNPIQLSKQTFCF